MIQDKLTNQAWHLEKKKSVVLEESSSVRIRSSRRIPTIIASIVIFLNLLRVVLRRVKQLGKWSNHLNSTEMPQIISSKQEKRSNLTSNEKMKTPWATWTSHKDQWWVLLRLRSSVKQEMRKQTPPSSQLSKS